MSQLFFTGPSSLSGGLALGATVLRVALAAFFLLLSYKAISADAKTAADFSRWGYSLGFLRLTGVLQGLGALALLAPFTSFWGGLLLVGVLLGAAATHLLHDPLPSTLSPLLVMTLVVVAVAPYLPPILR